MFFRINGGDRLIDLSSRNSANESMATMDLQTVKQLAIASKAWVVGAVIYSNMNLIKLIHLVVLHELDDLMLGLDDLHQLTWLV